MTTLANAMVLAALKSGLLTQGRVKKDGSMKARPYQVTKCWPRMKRNQALYSAKEVK